ncbi:hypothetical protein FVEG_14984 [Fusarium verticillioides 7600]|uniref:Uncharacterized protein n=1 Tax=Gibberella moniliformis (strain M3125 / FGSC 7600) TaxID=334819 RepID=W7M2U4_GIBM7|nr:hypothetical protein FVEG_14984 [Fusarium verticillioides 7600]EWG39232.1 hypothetical protein FVEG_14984 [Fusarium verticillioides 7600]
MDGFSPESKAITHTRLSKRSTGRFENAVSMRPRRSLGCCVQSVCAVLQFFLRVMLCIALVSSLSRRDGKEYIYVAMLNPIRLRTDTEANGNRLRSEIKVTVALFSALKDSIHHSLTLDR